MPRTYISVLLTFETPSPKHAIVQSFEGAVQKLSNQLPWIFGEVFPTSSSGAASLGIRPKTGNAPLLVDKGVIKATYKTLSASGFPPQDIPADVWPVSGTIDDTLFQSGAPVFAASIFSFTDQAVGLCVCLHHNVVDATSFAEALRLLAANMADSTFIFSGTSLKRDERLSAALSPVLEEASHLSLERIFELHPEYSKTLPSFPSEFPQCTSKLFKVPNHWINALKELLHKYTSNAPTTNTVISALIWTTISRVRSLRDRTLLSEKSRLVTAVNARQRIGNRLSTPQNPYFGNGVIYSLSTFPITSLAEADETPIRCLAKICDVIVHAQSESVINARHTAEIYHLVDKMEDDRSLFPGWDLFGSRDFTITSWADLGLYEMDFGENLGRPKYVRLPYMEADGVAIIMPRQRGSSDEMVEIMLMLRKDDMQSLDSDSMWQTLTKYISVNSRLSSHISSEKFNFFIEGMIRHLTSKYQSI